MTDRREPLSKEDRVTLERLRHAKTPFPQIDGRLLGRLLDQMEALEEGMEITADGVRITPGMTIWWIELDYVVGGDLREFEQTEQATEEAAYSTKDKAVQALKER